MYNNNYFSEAKKTVAESDFKTTQPKRTVAESDYNQIQPKRTVAESDFKTTQPKRTVAESDYNQIQPKRTVAESHPSQPARTPFVRRDPLEGKRIGDRDRYLLQTLLGQGGMSKVYQALDTKFEDKVVAVKLMTNYAATNNQHLIKRFMGEVRAISRLKHPNIIQIFDFGVTPNRPPFYGVPFYVMEHLEGKTLQSWLSKKPNLASNSSLKIIRQVAAGLKAAHDKGIVHRDLKPDNIFLVTGGAFGEIAKIIDFGIAKVVTANETVGTQLTKEGSFIGTYRYASPEQCRGALNIDKRSDIYSLGMILYEAISGRDPYSLSEDLDLSLADWIAYHLKATPKPIEEQPGCEHLGEKLKYIIMKCLAKSPEDRFSDLEELQNAFADNFVVPQTEENESCDPLEDTQLIKDRNQNSTPSTTAAEAKIDDNQTNLSSGSDFRLNLDDNPTNNTNEQRNKFSLKFIASAVAIAIALLGTGGYLISSRNTADNDSTAIASTETPIDKATTNDKESEESEESEESDRDLILAAQNLENQYLKQNYQECYQSALEHPQKDDKLIETWLGKCGLEAAKIQANAHSYSQAIALAQKIPQTTSNYQEVQQSIDNWSGNILDYATTVYKQGKLEQAINITKIVPENSSVQAEIPDLISQWKQQQANNQAIVEQAQNLLARGRWSDAKQEIEKIPSDFVFWRNQTQPILDTANQKINEIVAAERLRRQAERAVQTIPLRERLKHVPLLDDDFVRRRLGTN